MFTTIKNTNSNLPLIIDIPHSGRIYPSDFKYCCDLRSLQLTEDRYADILFEGLYKHSHTTIIEQSPRTFIDINRDNYNLEEKKGLRLITLDGKKIYATIPDRFEYYRRVKNNYYPYIMGVKKAINKCVKKYGMAIHLNLHTFPTTRIDKYSKNRETIPNQIYLGDTFGTTANPLLCKFIKNNFDANNLSVEINDLFPTGHLIKELSTPQGKINSIIIEVRRDTYLDEDYYICGKKLAESQKIISTSIISAINQFIDSEFV
ncbi:N-formylglutamate amidohydrolase [Iodobacter sp.]|uniref:N-formylglutamate amidohydrolase n=1 Tax=Iodobacter sp. TaxID=1915058 RepID=UPI0025D2BEF2|nr:N-formylglutamate amidohydrolase [Iodobacter sp.]